MADQPTVDQNGNLSGPRRTVQPSDPAMLKAAMSAKATPNPVTQPTQGSSGSGQPGFAGAINDAIKQGSLSGAPQSITQRKAKIDQGVSKALGDEFQ